MWLNLDHRAGFLLAQIDGTVDYEALFALSGLPAARHRADPREPDRGRRDHGLMATGASAVSSG